MKTENKYLQVNNMLFLLRKGEEITNIQIECKDGYQVTRIEGFTSSCDFITTYYPDITVSEWRGHNKDDIWTTQKDYNIITSYIVSPENALQKED